MISYISIGELLQAVFDFINVRYSEREEVPVYKDEPGFPKLLATLELVKDDNYYPDLLDKATYLFININKGHFFSNGNKRLSIVVLVLFLVLNNRVFKDESKEWYKRKLETLFPECRDVGFEDFTEFNSVDFCAYHLAIRTAASGEYNIDHQVLKQRITNFLKETTRLAT